MLAGSLSNMTHTASLSSLLCTNDSLYLLPSSVHCFGASALELLSTVLLFLPDGIIQSRYNIPVTEAYHV